MDSATAPQRSPVSLSLLLQALGVAGGRWAGWALARALYRDLGRSGAWLGAWQQRLDGVHRALWNRLRVDELYQELFVHPAQDFSRAAAWMRPPAGRRA